MKTILNMMRKVAGVCLCHRALYGAVALAHGAGAGHLIADGVVLAVVAGVYAVMALRG